MDLNEHKWEKKKRKVSKNIFLGIYFTEIHAKAQLFI
jgi:hypothetical protein